MRGSLFLKRSVQPLLALIVEVLLALTACAPRVACGVTNNVALTNLVFVPANITIAPGDTVLWTWEGNSHSTTSDTNGLWDSGVQSMPFSFSQTFASPGNFPYHCTVHQSFGMIGSVTVAAVNVTVTNFVFIPANVTINAGDTVLWTWTGGGHTTTSQTSGLWDSGFQEAPASFSHTFASPGTFSYYCNPHVLIGMVGSITVTAGQLSFQKSGNQLNLSWPVAGVTLQAQTNGPGLGLTTNWFDVAGSTATNQIVVPIDPANRSVFYRLAAP